MRAGVTSSSSPSDPQRTLTRALPVIKRYAETDVVLVGNFTGAQPQREAPYAEHVFNIRASYRQEMAALVDRFWQLGARNLGVYSQADAYGRSGTDGVTRGGRRACTSCSKA